MSYKNIIGAYIDQLEGGQKFFKYLINRIHIQQFTQAVCYSVLAASHRHEYDYKGHNLA